MINHLLIQQALRTQLLTLEVCTTGSTDLAATTTGYTRAVGSFLTDGFRAGMEVTGTGFSESANKSAKTITSVTATTLTCSGCTTESETTATLTVGLPADQAWENMDFTPTTGSPWIEENYLPGPMEQITLGPYGELQADPIYVVKVYVPIGVKIGAPRAYADALLTLFAPRTAITVAGHTCVVRTRPGPFSGQLLRTETGFVVVPITVPLRVRTANSI